MATNLQEQGTGMEQTALTTQEPALQTPRPDFSPLGLWDRNISVVQATQLCTAMTAPATKTSAGISAFLTEPRVFEV